MMSSDEGEEDYMSSGFLQKLEQSDVRPGLIFSSKTARQHQLEKRKLDADTSNNAASKKVKPGLKESLATPIDKSNKGFALLAKMGFKEGSGLGKSGEGIKDPVPLSMKTDRSGLGTETVRNMRKEKAEKMLQEMRGLRDKAMVMQREQFRSDKQLLFYQRRMEAILHKNQRTCFQLDSEKGVERPVDSFFWPASELLKGEGENGNDDDDGQIYDNNTNSTAFNRGVMENNYREIDRLSDVDGEEDNDSFLSSSTSILENEQNKCQKINQLSTTDMLYQIEQLESYLRRFHYYCVWCSSLFKDEKEMQSVCPGEGPESHGESLTAS